MRCTPLLSCSPIRAVRAGLGDPRDGLPRRALRRPDRLWPRVAAASPPHRLSVRQDTPSDDPADLDDARVTAAAAGFRFAADVDAVLFSGVVEPLSDVAGMPHAGRRLFVWRRMTLATTAPFGLTQGAEPCPTVPTSPP